MASIQLRLIEQRLMVEYHVATERYTAAVGELTQNRPTMSKDDYKKLLQLVEDTRNECKQFELP